MHSIALSSSLPEQTKILTDTFAPMRLGNSLASIIGGLLMGMGAMYSACNLGGFFDGTASGSLHGWVWMLMALAGSLIGIRLRPLFKL